MRRAMFGLGVLIAVLLGAGAYAFGEIGESVTNRRVESAMTGASEPQAPNRSGPPLAPSATTAPSQPAPSTNPTAGTPTTPATKPSGSPSAAPPSGRPSGAGQGGCPQGDRQRDVEAALATLGTYGQVSVDGTQSAADCEAIIKFQRRFGVSPANGRAGGTTADVARRIAASTTAQERAKCNAAATGLTACVDLTLQTVWVVRDGAVVWGPTIVRTGFKGYATPAGTYKINNRNIKEWSDKYKVWLPYWQHFTQGMGFHQTTTYIHNSGIGSHGCVNVLASDARDLWNLIGYGTTVQTFGRRPGT